MSAHALSELVVALCDGETNLRRVREAHQGYPSRIVHPARRTAFTGAGTRYPQTGSPY